MFKCLTEKGPDNREVRRPTTFKRIRAVAEAEPHEVVQVIDRFRTGGYWFLMPPAGETLTEDSLIDISHESLIRQWKQLRGWAREEAQSKEKYLEIVSAAVRYEKRERGLGRDPELKLSLEWLESAKPNQAWAEFYNPNLSLVRNFLEKSKVQQDVERAANEREQETRRRLKRLAVAGLAAGFAVALGFAVFALIQWQQAAAQRARAEQNLHAAVIATSQSYRDKELDVSLLLATEAKQMADTPRARTNVLETLHHPPPSFVAFLSGHTNTVFGVAFSPDGATLASASSDKTIRLWDVKTRQPLGTLSGHTDTVLGVAFSPDGATLASGSWDYTIRLWDFDPESLVMRACKMANRNFSEEEWKNFFGEQPYRKTCPELPVPSESKAHKK